MTADAQNKLNPGGFFAFRTALLPFGRFLDWSAGLEAPAAQDPQALERSLEADRTRLLERLRGLASDPVIREALFLASPDLDEALSAWLASPEAEKDPAKADRVVRTLVRYFSRMCGRATPFGLFAGCSVGRLGEQTRLAVAGQDRYLRHTRLDNDYLSALTETLAQRPEVQDHLTFRPNTSLYEGAGRLRYAESRQGAHRSRSYHLVAVENSPYLADTLKRAEKGATLRELAQGLVDEDVTLEEALEFMRELAAHQLLVPDLAPTVTGREPIHDLLDQLRTHPEATGAYQGLEAAQRALEAIDRAPLGIAQDRYKAIAEDLKALPAKVELSRLFQVDMVKPAPEATLGKAVMDEVLRAVELLHRMTPAGSGRDPLSQFRQSFMTRYESREVPLVEVLDEESGIGFGSSQAPGAEGSPLLEGLAFPGAEPDATAAWGPREVFLYRKLEQLQREGKQVLELGPEDLKVLEAATRSPLPDSLAVMARVAAASQEALDAGDFQLTISHAGGPSGANLLGRFCHGDAELTEHVQRLLQEEEALRPDAIFAEIVHLPEGRIGNVLLRPLIRGWEIPFLGRSGAPEDRQIPVTDLMVSVQGNRIVLRSKSLDREVIPRLTTAHNYQARSLGVYRFLCMLQHQGVTGGLGWNWSTLDSAADFLPRVTAGRLVLAKARWSVRQDELKGFLEKEGAERFRGLQTWREGRRIPRFALLVDGDNKLLVDFDNILSAETFLELVKARPGFRLEELYPGPDELCAEGPEGTFIHEIVVPFTRQPAAAPQAGMVPRAEAARPPAEPARRFAPGSEWLYAKIYAGTATLDRLLREAIAPLVADLKAQGLIDGWFFIRYGDPDWHLRLRFHGDPMALSGAVLPRLHAAVGPWLEGQGPWKLQLDTYEREVERYGADTMLASERLFQHDSEAVLEILQHFPGEAAADARWRLGLRGMDQLLGDLGLDLQAKYDLLSRVRDSFLAEHRIKGPYEKPLGDKFRRERKGLVSLLDPSLDDTSPLAPGLAVLRKRSRALAPVAEELRARAEGRPGLLMNLASSYLHMHANRMLRSAARAQETVMYDFLARIYESELARARKGAGKPAPAGEPA